MTQSTMDKIGLALILIAIIALGISVYYLGPSIMGFIIKEFNYEQNLNIVVTASGNYTWQLENAGDLKSVKLDGRVTNYGKARVYLVSNEIKYLVFDSAILNEASATASNETNLITGFAVKDDSNSSDKDKQNKNKKPAWNGVNEFIINGTAEINLSQYFADEDGDALIYSVSQTEGLDVSIGNEIVTITTISDSNFNTTITFIASDGIDSRSHVADLIVLKSVITILNETNQTANLTNETINQTQIQNLTNATTINETNQTIITNQTKTISISLAYNSGTVYDANDNGEESVNGVVDLSVENTGFSWDADKSKLCTRWEVYSIEDGRLTTFCNGNDECCAFLGLLPSNSNWNDIYYSTFGKDSASHDNIISSQVIYYDVNLTIENPKSEIYNSEWSNLSVKFFEDESEFSGICIETCDLTGLNRSSYTLLFEIEDDAVLRIDKVKYNVLADVQNNGPILLQNFSAINVPKNKNISINLSKYFSDPDGDALTYGYYKADNITMLFDKDIAAIVPDKGVEGIRFTYITVNDSESIAVSNVFMLNISEEKFKPRVVIGRPVKWVSKILVDSNVNSVNLTLPDTASNITVAILNDTLKINVPDDKMKILEDGKVKDKNVFEIEKKLGKIDRKISILEEAKLKDALKVIVDENEFENKEIDSKLNELYAKKSELDGQLNQLLGINDNLITASVVALSEIAIDELLPILVINQSLAQNTEIEVEYETEAPIAIENEVNSYTKQIKVVSETSYEDVLSYSTLNDVPQSAIKLYWVQNNSKTLFDNVDYIDENLNGLIDRIEWIIPHLSNQTFEVSITVLNVQSYPTVGGNWTVAFNTTGIGNLTILAFNGTSYAEKEIDDSATLSDLDTLELKCDANVLEPLYIVDLGNLSLEGLSEISGDVVKEINSKKGFRGLLTLNSLDESPYQSGNAFASRADINEVALYLNIPEKSINKKEEKSGFHSLANAPKQNLISTRTKDINQYLFKYLSVDIDYLTKLGWQSLANAPDLRSGVSRGQSNASELVRTRSQLTGSNSLSNGMNLPPPASKNNTLNENSITKFNNEKNNQKIADFFTMSANRKAISEHAQKSSIFDIIPSAYALHVGSGAYTTINFNGQTYALLAKEQLIGHSYKVIGVYYENYSCDNRTGYWTVKVLTEGIHTQRFNFSSQIADAHNLASVAGAGTNGSINQFIDDTDTDFLKGNVTPNSIVAGSGASANVTINISLAANQTQNIQGRGIPINSSTVLYVRFEQGTGSYANDSSQYGNNGTLRGTPLWNSSTKFGSYGVDFQASESTDFINFGKTTTLNLNLSMTIEAWIKFRALDLQYIFSDLGGDGSVCQICFRIGVNIAGQLGYFHKNTDGTNFAFDAGEALTTDTWYHIAVVRDDLLKTVRIYVNGMNYSNTSYVGKTVINNANTDSLAFGIDGTEVRTASYYFDGIADELVIWNMSLSNDTIYEHFQKGWGYFNTSNFTSQSFDAGAVANWSYISWQTANNYQQDLSSLVNASTVLYMKFDNGTLESEKEIVNDSINLGLLLHFDNVTGLENNTFFLDNSTYLNNATCTGTSKCPLLNISNFKFGKSLSFDGVDDEIDVKPHRMLQNTRNLTVEAWIYPDIIQAASIGIITKGISAQREYYLWQASNGALRFAICSSGQTCTENLGPYIIKANTWQHVAATWDGSTMKVYANGEKVADTAYTGALNSVNDNLTIGSFMETASSYFDGTMDEVAVWNRTLSDTEIMIHSGKRVVDNSIYGNNATRKSGTPSDFGANFTTNSKFNKALVFDGVDDYVNTTSPIKFTAIEMWANHNSNGWTYFVNNSGMVYKFGAQTDKNMPFHNSSGSLTIGQYPDGTFFAGTIDEVAVWNDTLSLDEIRKHYERGALKLNFNYRTSVDNVTWTDWAGAGNSTLSAITANAINRYFQYQAFFNTTDAAYTPVLHNVSINYSLRNNLTIFDDTERRIVIANELFNFTANFTDGVNPINGTSVNCTISLNSTGSYAAPIKMAYEPSTSVYYYNTSYTNKTIANFNITCDATVLGYNLVQVIDIFNVTIARYALFNGSTTDFNNLNAFDSISNAVLEIAAFGKIEWKNPINVTAADLDRYVNISANKVGLFAENLHRSLNSSANITLYNLNLASPKILKDNLDCPSSVCTVITYNGANITFNVTSFSNFSAANGTLNITINLNASVVVVSSPVAVSGHVNLSNGSNVTNNIINIFLNGTLMGLNNLTPNGNYKQRQFIDDTDTDFLKGNVTPNSRVVGSGASANVTINISLAANQTPNLPRERFIVANESTVLLMHFEEGTGQYANDSGFYQRNNGTLGANTGSASDDPVWNSSAKFGSFALGFNGASTFVTVPDSNDFALGGNFTIELWHRFDIAGDNEVYFISQFVDANNYWLAQLYLSQLGWGEATGAPGSNINCGAFEPDANRWYHLAWSAKGSTLRCYVDGVQHGNAISISSVTNFAANLLIGEVAAANFVDGLIDEVAIWNMSLSNDTIYEHFQKGWGYFNTSNFTSQVFDANSPVNWSYISWQTKENYQQDLSSLVNASTLLYFKFDNITGESERPLNETNNISNEQNLVLYLKLNNETGENDTFFRDYSQYLNNGSCNLASVFCPNYTGNNKFGKFGLVFDGVNDYVNVSDHSSLDAITRVTVEGWFRFDSLPGGLTKMAGKWNEIGNQRSYALGFEAGDKVAFLVSGDGTGAVKCSVPQANVPSTNTWHHYAGVYDGSTCKLYADGVLDVSASYSSNIFSGSANFIMGGSGSETFGGVNNYMKGAIDEVTVWNRTLSDTEIAVHSGKRVIDNSIYGNNATRKSGTPSDFGRNFTTNSKFGKALALDGVDDYVNTTSPLRFAAIEMWANHNNNGWTFFINNSGIMYKFGAQTGMNMPFHNSSGSITIGQYPDGTYFAGTIDEVAVWNDTLSIDEIRKHYERGALKLNLSYRTSADNATWTEWTGAGNSTLSATTANSINRYFQYQVVFNTSDAAYTPILNNVTINYTGIFTDSFGNYNYTFTAPPSVGIYTIKVNTTFTDSGGSVSGEASTNLTVLRTNLTIFDDTERRVVIANELFNFTANFTDGVNPINGTNINCTISLNSTGSYAAPIKMAYDIGTKVYYYNTSFTNKTIANFNITCDATVSGYNLVQVIDIFNVSIARYALFNGSTTDFNNLNAFDNISNSVLEIAAFGKIEWKNPINVTAADLDRYVNISSNLVGLFPENLHRTFNSSANITIYNVNLVSPRILRDNQACPSTICTLIRYNGANITFNVTSFSNYSGGNGTVDITINLNASVVIISSPVAVSGHVNLSNGSNVSNNLINIFLNGTNININVTNPTRKNVIDDSDTDFTLGVFNSTNVSGTGGAANLTLNTFNATGGTITYSGGYTIHNFTTNGTFTPTNGAGNVEVLVVAGGGGGGTGYGGGGGGAGGVVSDFSHSVTAQVYTVTIGGGGAGSEAGDAKGANGQNSVFNTITAVGGGGGGSYAIDSGNGASGGSGGGCGFVSSWPACSSGGAGTSGQGNSGGLVGACSNSGGGGGGAGQTGRNASGSGGGAGGNGVSSSISGSATNYGGGGGAASDICGSSGAGGSGGGGVGGASRGASGPNIYGADGTANTGGGGGGGTGVSAAPDDGGAGGSGVVIIRYLKYVNTGNFTSRAFDAGGIVNWTQISWSNMTPVNTNLTLYYRTSSDNVTFSNWNSVSDNTLSVTALNSTNRYFQYLASFNTSNANLTPILNNVTINYTGIFTDSFGNYNYTFTAPSTAGIYPIKVNTTYLGLYGEASTNLTVKNRQTVNCNVAGCFIIQNAAGANIAVFDSMGNININNILSTNTLPTADTNDFIIQNSSGGLNLVITNPQGDMLIKNYLNQIQSSPLSPTLSSFVVQNSTGRTVAYLNSTGGLFLLGTLTDQVLFE